MLMMIALYYLVLKKGHEIEKGLTNLGNDHLKAFIEQFPIFKFILWQCFDFANSASVDLLQRRSATEVDCCTSSKV